MGCPHDGIVCSNVKENTDRLQKQHNECKKVGSRRGKSMESRSMISRVWDGGVEWVQIFGELIKILDSGDGCITF